MISSKKRTKRLFSLATLVIGAASLLLASQAVAAPDGSEPCRTQTVKQIVKDVQKNARTIIAKSLIPGARPESWALEFKELLSDSTMLVGLCTAPPVVERGCPFCSTPEDMPLNLQTAPILLIRWVHKQPSLFDPRVRPARSSGYLYRSPRTRR